MRTALNMKKYGCLYKQEQQLLYYNTALLSNKRVEFSTEFLSSLLRRLSYLDRGTANFVRVSSLAEQKFAGGLKRHDSTTTDQERLCYFLQNDFIENIRNICSILITVTKNHFS